MKSFFITNTILSEPFILRRFFLNILCLTAIKLFFCEPPSADLAFDHYLYFKEIPFFIGYHTDSIADFVWSLLWP